MKNLLALSTISKLLLPNKSHKVKYFLGLMLCVCGIIISVNAAPWELDPTFGNGGRVVSSQNNLGGTSGNRFVLLPDGKIAMIGNKVTSGQYAGIIVARYNADGSLDTTFGTNGWATVEFGMQREFGEAIDVQMDGKIVIGASTRSMIGNLPYYYINIARFNTDGTLDTTFDGDGKITIDFNDLIGGFYSEKIDAIKVGSDGKILAGGKALNPGVNDRYVFVRVNTDGSPDNSFGTNGKFADQILGASNLDYFNDMIVLPDGKFVAVGMHRGSVSNERVAIKYNVNGSREWDYRQGTMNPSVETENFKGITALPDGKFIVVGKRGGKVVVMRLNADGTEDTSFFNAPGMPNGQAVSAAIQSDGKIVVNIESNKFTLARFNADGSLDATFGGFIETSISGWNDYATKVVIQPDGKYLLGGSATTGTFTPHNFALARFKGQNSPTVIRTKFDYDGDGRSDVSVFRPSENKWFILRSSDSAIVQQIFGLAGDIPTPADYDGDGKTDMGIFRPSTGVWWYAASNQNNAFRAVQYGQNGDIPRPADFDADGKADYIVFRPSENKWYRLGSGNGGNYSVEFGNAGDKPVIGDFDGDGKADMAIYRPSTGTWWYSASSQAGLGRAVQFGISTDIPVPADFDGDGTTDFAVYRPSDGVWHILESSTGRYFAYQFGISEDKPVAADYDGDGKADGAVFRPSNGSWYILRSTAGFFGVQWGSANDIPSQNSFIQ